MAQKVERPAVAQPVKATDQRSKISHEPVQFVFTKSNYQILFAAIAVIATGFLLMSGTTDIYDTRKIVIAPLVVLAGFALGFFAIFKKNRN